ncbi:MAG: protein-glutamate O-methyltransferase CheR [bacterium]|nr:protein-glutamate O-methyltransferase CheR [bacterium]
MQVQPSLPGMTDDEFQRFREIVYAQTHIYCDDVKRPLFERKIRSRLKELHLYSYRVYYEILRDPHTDKRELSNFIERISVHETSFFRIRDHFRALQEQIFPQFFQQFPEKTLRIWSAGCSTGEEPYSIALSFLDFLDRTRTFPASTRPSLNILATDLSSHVVRKAQQGCYSCKQVEKIPQALLDKYGIPHNDHYQFTDDVKQLVTFNMSNLIRPNAFSEQRFHLIFCRNVLIYFDRRAQTTHLKELSDRLVAGGYLFLGDAETIHVFPDITRQLTHVHSGNSIIYKKHGVQS